MREICATQIVVHAGAGALRIHVSGAASRNNIVNVHGAKIDAQPGTAGSVGHARMHLCAGKKQQASGRRNYPNLWVELHGLLRARLFTGVFFQELSSVLAAGTVPLVIVVRGGPIAHWLAPIARVKSHGVFGNDRIDGHPPVDLAHGSRIPSVSMRMESVSNPGGEVLIAS